MSVQLEYINHLLQFFYYAIYACINIMLNAFSHLLCSRLFWHNRLVPTGNVFIDKGKEPLHSTPIIIIDNNINSYSFQI